MHLCRCGAIVCASVREVEIYVHLGVVGEAVVVKFMTVEDSIHVFSVRDELLRPVGPRTDPCGTPWLD